MGLQARNYLTFAKGKLQGFTAFRGIETGAVGETTRIIDADNVSGFCFGHGCSPMKIRAQKGPPLDQPHARLRTTLGQYVGKPRQNLNRHRQKTVDGQPPCTPLGGQIGPSTAVETSRNPTRDTVVRSVFTYNSTLCSVILSPQVNTPPRPLIGRTS